MTTMAPNLRLAMSISRVRELSRARTRGGAAYVSVGSGSPIVFVHGVGLRLEAWAPQISHFSENHHVIALDLPGHGESAPLPVGSTVHTYVDWLGEVISDLNLTDVNLVGHSMGALIARGAAVKFPGNIARVACLNGVMCREPAAKRAVMERAAAIWTEGVDMQGPLQRWFDEDPTGKAARSLVVSWLTEMDPKAYAITYTAFATGDEVFVEELRDLTMPSLFLTGDGDPNSTPAMSENMADMTPNGEAFIIQNHRHMVNLTAPDAVNSALEKWLNRPAQASA